MGSHINKDGKFQSDKYPTCPPGKVPLSVEDPMAQDLLFEYAQRRRTVDVEFADDLEKVLEAAGHHPAGFYGIWRYWFEMGERQSAWVNKHLAFDLKMPARPRLIVASFMRWLAGEEVLNNGLLSRRRGPHTFCGIIDHLQHLERDSLAALRGMLRHVAYNEAEADALTQAFKLMFPHVPERVENDGPAPLTDEDAKQALIDAEDRQQAFVDAGFTPRNS